MGASAGVAFAVGAPDARAATTLDDALKKIAKGREGLSNLAGPFTQERTIGLLSTKVKSTGTMTLVKPDRLRWELAPPDAVTYWIGPEGLAYQNARGDKGRVPPTHARIAAALEDLRAVLGGDLASLKARYDLALLSETDVAFTFSAKPRGESAPSKKLKAIEFELDARDSTPRRVVLVDGPKDKTDIVFDKLLRNGAVDAALLKPPF